jgi:hypothetical protein
MERKVGFQVQRLLSTCNQKKKSSESGGTVPGNDKKFGRSHRQESNQSGGDGHWRGDEGMNAPYNLISEIGRSVHIWSHLLWLHRFIGSPTRAIALHCGIDILAENADPCRAMHMEHIAERA